LDRREGERERGRKRREGEKERILVILGAEIDGYRPRLESKRKGFFGVMCKGRRPSRTGTRSPPVRGQKRI
jgi:hypothetical protein